MKLWKKVILSILVVLLLMIAFGAFSIYRIVYPKVLVSGTGDKKVICVGDSLTYGQGVITSRDTDSYPAQLAGFLGEEYQTLNYGLPNRTLQSTGNMPYCEEKYYKESLEQDAEIVIIMIGSNDSKPDFWDAKRFEEEYLQFIQTYQAMESAPDVYIVIPPAIFLENPNSGDCSDIILREELIPIIIRLAEQTGADMIDIYSITKDHSEWYGDGLHLGYDGNKAMAEEIYAAITEKQTDEKNVQQ